MRKNVIIFILSLPGFIAMVFAAILINFRAAYDNDVIRVIIENKDMLPTFDKDLQVYIYLSQLQEYRFLILALGVTWIIIVILLVNILKGNDVDEQES